MNNMQIETAEFATIDANENAEPRFIDEKQLLIDALGLTGQQQLAGEPEKKLQERCPYRILNGSERFVYGQLLSEKTSLQKFAAGEIPLQVLRIAASARGFFEVFEVWHSPILTNYNAILVGRKNNYASDNYILIRWGLNMLPFSELEPIAVQFFRYAYTNKLAEIRDKLNGAQAALDAVPDENILKGVKTLPSFYL